MLPSFCALCGDTLARTDRIVLQWKGLKGRPMVGWHIGCHNIDPLWIAHERTHDALATIRGAMDRGRGRVVSRYRTSAGYGVRDGVHVDVYRALARGS